MSLFLEQGEKSPSISPPALVTLRQNIQNSVRLLGNAFLRGTSPSLSKYVDAAAHEPNAYFQALVQLTYRLMFLLIAERRELLHPVDTPSTVRHAYRSTRSFARIAELGSKDQDPDAADLWQGLRQVLAGLARGDSSLGLAPLGGIFAAPEHELIAAGTVNNRTLVEVARLFAFVRINDISWPVDWAAVRGEELGTFYEQLLEFKPELDVNAREFRIDSATTSTTSRRSSGSYYTPSELVDVVIRDALERCIDENLSRDGNEPKESLLNLRVVDPACGCGHFLIAAARRIAGRLEPHLEGLPGPPSPRVRALRLVISNCIYGVDLNPTAIELCKVNLWLEAAEPGLPLSFLDGQLQQGNALIGAPANAISTGVPALAWRAQDTPHRQELKRRCRATPDNVSAIEPELSDEQVQVLSDVWCASFFWPLDTQSELDAAPTNEVWQQLLRGAGDTTFTRDTARRLAVKYSFFHWHLRFPRVFRKGGFDVVLGNPPWIAHAGRAAQPLAPEVKHFYSSNYPAFSKYITTHGLFASVLPKVLRAGGYLGFVVPSSLSELAGYEPTRKAHDALCTFVDELTDFGEGRFEGVTQPCMALITKRQVSGRSDAAFGSPWPVSRPDLSTADRELLHYLSTLPTLPANLFAERGLQSDPALRAHFIQSDLPRDRFTVPVREGTDVREFELLPARYHVDPEALGKRLRSRGEFQEVVVVVRQTARYPIAAVSDGLAFRNSLLACLSHPSLSPLALAALLNSTLVRWHHYMRFRDARQPVLPQVKISHLRAIPEPPSNLKELNSEFTELGTALTSKSVPHAGSLRAQLDQAVARAYGLTSSQVDLLRLWRYA